MRRWAFVAVALLWSWAGVGWTATTASAAPAAATPAAAPPAAVGGPGRFVPVEPVRLLDTRDRAGPVPAGTSVRVAVAGRAGVPADAVAVAVTLTATEVTAPGHLTVFPAGRGRPATSTLNVAGSDTRANLAFVALGAGEVEVYSSTSAHVIVDLAGYWEPAPAAVAAGRFVSVGPSRVLDTRDGTGAPAGLRAPGSRIVVAVPGAGPTAAAVVVSLTATSAVRAGHLSVFPAGSAVPETSNLNLEPGGTRANLAVVALSAGGIEVHTTAGGHVVVDVLGIVTGPTASPSAAGRFVGLDAPVRMLDTRTGDDGVTRLGHDGTVAVRVGGRGGVPAQAAAAAVNVAVVEPAAAGFGAVWPAGMDWPGSSNVNVEHRRATAAGAAVSGLDGQGWLQLRSSASADVVLDVTGYFLAGDDGPPVATDGPTARRIDGGDVVDVVDRLGFELSPVARSGRDAPPLPPGSGSGRRVVFSGAAQRVWAVEADGTVVRSWLVSGSRVPAWNEWPGTYAVYLRQELTASYTGQGLLPYFIAYRRTVLGNDIGFHEIPTDGAGVPVQTVEELGLRRSAGCQRQAHDDAVFLWHWAPLGTTVVVV